MARKRSLTRLLTAAALCCAAVTGTVPAASAAGDRGADPTSYRITWDDFRGGFSSSGPDARWAFPTIGSFVTDDGRTSTSGDGLHLVSGGVNPATGEPAFTHTVGQENSDGSGLPGNLDHVKWLAFTNHTSSAGYQGFDAEPGRVLSCETWMSGRTYGTRAHPFGGRVTDPDDDLRLASVGMPVLDPETSMIFDFFVTNKRVYAFYERVPDNRATLGDYSAFTYAVPVASTAAGRQHHFKISYDRSAGVVRWVLDGRVVFTVDRIGHRLPSRKYMMLDNGGTDMTAAPRQLSCGMGLFTIMDGGRPGTSDASALIRLTNAPDHYYGPRVGAPTPQTFYDNASAPGNRLFGQGAGLDMSRYVVSSVPVAAADADH
ncbi:DUF6081 family protein [Streptomyces sp. NPDC048362]|uniref:DUF6081 family protein n=1 Tax=unclassified Streptomyces TaxID=2593676 RepID=UPI0033D337EF